jgi:hypothetical protein
MIEEKMKKSGCKGKACKIEPCRLRRGPFGAAGGFAKIVSGEIVQILIVYAVVSPEVAEFTSKKYY